MKHKHFTSTYVSVAAILLSCLGAISVGFASWVISQGDNANTIGNINADSVNTSISGVSVSKSEVFEIGKYFFRNGNTYLNNESGLLSYSITYSPSVIGKSSITLSCSLSFSTSGGESLAIFKSNYLTSVKYDGATQATLDFATSNNKAVEFSITQSLSGNDSFSKSLEFTFNNKLIAKYGDDMADGTFYLRLEAE